MDQKRWENTLGAELVKHDKIKYKLWQTTIKKMAD